MLKDYIADAFYVYAGKLKSTENAIIVSDGIYKELIDYLSPSQVVPADPLEGQMTPTIYGLPVYVLGDQIDFPVFEVIPDDLVSITISKIMQLKTIKDNAL
jgi:hypothetical protein